MEICQQNIDGHDLRQPVLAIATNLLKGKMSTVASIFSPVQNCAVQ